MTGPSSPAEPGFRLKLHALIASLQTIEASLDEGSGQNHGSDSSAISPEVRKKIQDARKELGEMALAPGDSNPDENQDAADLKPAVQQALEREIARWASFPQVNTVPVLELSLTGEILYGNPASLRLLPDLRRLGIHHPYLRGWDEIVKEACKGSDPSPMRDVQVGEKTYQQFFVYVKDFNTIRVYGQDVTDRCQMEEELRISNEELNEQRAFLEAILQQLPIGVAVVDAKTGAQILTNTAREKILRDSPEPTRSFSDFQNRANLHLDGSTYALEELPLMRALRSGRPVQDEVMKLRRGDGAEIIIQANSAPIYLNEELIAGVYVIWDITDQVKTARALRESEARYRAVVETSPDAIIVHRDNRFLYANPAALTLYGAESLEQLSAHKVLKLVAPVDLNLSQERMQQIDGGARLPVREMQLLRLDGQAVDVEVSAAPIEFQGAQAIQAVIRDTTRRKRAEANLQASEARLRTLMDEAPVAIAISRESKFLYANPAYLAMHGISSMDELIGRPVYAQVAPQSQEESKERAARRQRGLPVEDSYEFTAVRSDGTRIPVLAAVKRVDLADGPATVGFFQDISERKEMEDALRQSEAKYRQLIETASEGVWVTDPETRTTFVNRQMAKMLGYNPEEMLGRKSVEFLDEDTRARLPELIKRRQEGIAESLEYNLRRKDGSALWVISNAAPLFDKEGQYAGSFGMLTDISLRKKREVELNALNRTLRAISATNQVLMRAETETEFMDEVCRIIVEDCGHALAWIGLAEPGADPSVRMAACAGFDLAHIEAHHFPGADISRGPTRTSIRTGKPIVCLNLQTDPQFAAWRAAESRHDFASMIVLPLMAEAEAFGALTIYSRQPDPFSEDEVNLLSELSGDLSFGIKTIRLRRANEEAQDAVKASEEKYRSLFNGMTEGFALHEIVCDENGEPCDYRFLEINPAFERLTGLKQADVIGRLHNDVLPGDNPIWLKAYGQVALSGEPVHFENYSPVLKQHYEVFAYRPAPRQFAVLFMNITARKEIEDKLRQSEALYRAIGESIDYGVWVCAPDGKNIYASDSFLNLVGLTQQQCSDFGWGDVLHPDDAERTLSAWKECVSRGGTWDIEHRFRGVDGEWHPVLARGIPVRDDSGQITSWAGINLDISRIKQAEEALRQAHDELEARVEERTAELELTNEELRVEIDERLRAEEINRQNASHARALAEVSRRLSVTNLDEKATLDLVTQTASQAIGGSCVAWLLSPDGRQLVPESLYHPDPAVRDALRLTLALSLTVSDVGIGQVALSGKPLFAPQPTRAQIETVARSRRYSRAHTDSVSSLMIVPLVVEGKTAGALVLTRDQAGQAYTEEEFKVFQSLADRAGIAITNTRLYQNLAKALQQEQTLRQQLIQAEKNLALNRMVSSVAHEINNPIQTIINCLYLLRGVIPPEAPEREALDMASSETHRIAGLVQQLRELYRPGQDRAMRPLEVHDTLEEIHKLLMPHLAHHHVDWVAENIPAGVVFNGIPDHIKQVFLNICLNAVDAMDPDGGKITVKTIVDAHSHQVGIAITDTGPGIPSEYLDSIFEPFFTTKTTGTGLGLAITFDIVRSHGGRISVENQPGSGATFTVWLPMI